MTAANEHADFPPIPFTDTDKSELRTEDIRAAKAIGYLASGIFLTGIFLYLGVMVWVWSQPPIYSLR
ncbi:MAG TPA: hypothetical protein VGZ47_06900 [Gemmataceae bacterium]|jgi:hypothetical protein|nr:hypothetical protein [Gemmataceae bacterium]